MASTFIKASVTGIEPLVRSLDRFKKAIRNRGLRKGMNAFTKPVLKAAKARCPRRYGHLRKSLGRKTKTKNDLTIGRIFPRAGFKVQVGVVKRGPRAGAPIYEDPQRIAHLVEQGHGGPHPAGPHPFMRPALDSERHTGTEAMAKVLREFVETEAVK